MSESVQHPDKSGVEEHPSREVQSSGTVTRYQSLALLGSSLLAAVSTLLVTMIAQRALNGSELTEFLLFWAALFTVTGIITGIQPEITRAVGTARTRAVADRALANRAASGGAASAEGSAPQGARVVTVTAALGAIAGALVLVSSPLWAASADSAFGGGGRDRYGGGRVPLRPAGDYERCDRR